MNSKTKNSKKSMQNFDVYIIQGEPSQKEKAQIWQTAIGLQDVDGLKPSEYLLETAKEHIENKITIDEVKYRIENYYKQLSTCENDEKERTEEAESDTVNDTVKAKNDTVFSLIQQNPKITATKLAEQLGIGIATVKRELKRLKNNGQIERIGSDKTGEWKVVRDC